MAIQQSKSRSAPARPQVKTQVHSMPEKVGAKAGTQVVSRQAAAVAKAPSTAMANVPEHIKQMSRGNENVGMADVVIPRIELVQALSPCLDKSDSKYIPGAGVGMLFNSVTRQLYGEQVVVCPVYFRKQWLVWKDRKKGGGFGGAFDSAALAQARIEEEPANEQADWDIQETAQQIVLTVDQDTGETAEAVVSMSRTKLKVSRSWNSLIRIAGFDRWSRIYSLFGVDDTNNAGDKFKNLGVSLIEFAPKAVYEQAEQLYFGITAGTRKVVVDEDYDESVIDAGAALAGDSKEY